MCECISVRALDGSHIMIKSFMAASSMMECIFDSSRPSSREVSPRDRDRDTIHNGEIEISITYTT